jgi:hypothetical protein
MLIESEEVLRVYCVLNNFDLSRNFHPALSGISIDNRTQRTIDMARRRSKYQKASEIPGKKHRWKYAGFDAFNVRPLL